ncbi:hypothetical protein LSH36_654g01031 [Paralvinella palmiformis]|uniref:Uncharacterized protein n=1 Tax=Paralvinella palmiformis TaxID=53620 RepID=A0AAD9MVN7_9ANNE|nr:hypothetical protein LSH36_654g01031 [Paralvinella palmiformis]
MNRKGSGKSSSKQSPYKETSIDPTESSNISRSPDTSQPNHINTEQTTDSETKAPTGSDLGHNMPNVADTATEIDTLMKS